MTRHANVSVSMTVLFILLGTCVAARAQQCHDYETPVTLTGVLQSRIFAGPPNYESIKKGDRKETAVILVLSKPTCTNTGPDEEAEARIREMQLVITKESDWKTVRRLMKKRAVISGTLFHGNTGHHRTDVLIYVTNIR